MSFSFNDLISSFVLWWKRHPQLMALAVGQVLSLLITGTGVTSQLLASKYNVNIPTTQSLFNYVLLAIVYGIIHFRKESFIQTLKQKWFIYLPLALVDVEANYLVVKAYQYTSITSVMLLDCFTIPCVMIFTFFILKTKYNWRHCVGVVFCLIGLGVLVWSDAKSNSDSAASGSHPLFGDFLCLFGAFLYAVSNTGQEIIVKKWSRSEFLAMIGIFGAPLNGIQLIILERKEVLSIGGNAPVILLIISFAIILFSMYSLTPYMLSLSGSTLFNLSLLTSDAYAILFGLFLFHKSLHWAYWIALLVIVIGLCLYNIKNEPATSKYDRNSVLDVNEQTDGELPPDPVLGTPDGREYLSQDADFKNTNQNNYSIEKELMEKVDLDESLFSTNNSSSNKQLEFSSNRAPASYQDPLLQSKNPASYQ